MKDLGKRVLSRKFLLSVAGLVLVLLFPDKADAIVQVVALFVGAEGAKDLADVVSRNRGK